MIKNRVRTVAWVWYEMVFGGEVLDMVVTGEGGIRNLIAQADRNPGMSIIATVYGNPVSDTEPVEILSRRRVYPVD